MVVLVLGWCAPAQAVTRTVARSGAFDIRATEKGGNLCITLRRERHYQGQECGRIPRSPQRPLSIFPDVGVHNYASAVPPSVRIAETEDRSGKRERHRTFSAPGFSARFVLIPAPPRAVFVRFYGADGTLLGMDAGPEGYIGFHENATPVLGESVTAYTEPRIAPTPDQPDRIATLACIDVANSRGGGGQCEDNSIVLLSSCDGPGIAGGIVAADVVSVRLTLGTGAAFVIPAVALPAVFGGRRAIGAEVPRGEAVREAVALDAAGQGIARTAVGTPPGQSCASADRGDDGFGGYIEPTSPPAGAVVVASAGGPPLVVADQDDLLCVALGALEAGYCPFAPVDSDEPTLLERGGTVAGALSRDASRVTLELDRGPAITVGTTDGAAYTGRWAGRVRFFAAPVPAGRHVTGAVVRDAAGTIIGVSPDGVPRPAGRRTLFERDGQGLQVARDEEERPCVTAFATDPLPVPRFCTDPNPGTPIDGPIWPYGGAVVVPCAPRRALAYGDVPDRLRLPEVVLDGNRTLRTRRIKRPGNDDVWFAFLPDAGVRGLRAGKQRVALRLPPASRQCGYALGRSF